LKQINQDQANKISCFSYVYT